MVNSEKFNATAAALSNVDLATLVGRSGVFVEKTSPLAFTAGIPPAGDAQVNTRLQQLGFLISSSPPNLTPQCLNALKILASPDVEIRLVWGDAGKINFSTLFAAAGSGSGAMVAFNRATQDRNNISYFVSQEEITGLVRDRIAFSELKVQADLSIKADAAALPVFFAALDLQCEARLKAALDRTPVPDVEISVEAAKKILVDAKTATALDWYAPLGYMMLPHELPDDAAIASGLQALVTERVITMNRKSGKLSPSLQEFAFRAFPIVTYFGATVGARQNPAFGGAQFALVRSPSTLLLVQRASDKTGESFSVDSISTSNVPELLFNLATLPFAAPPAPVPTATQIKFCPKCGDPLQSGEKFCDKCGAKLTWRYFSTLFKK